MFFLWVTSRVTGMDLTIAGEMLAFFFSRRHPAFSSTTALLFPLPRLNPGAV